MKEQPTLYFAGSFRCEDDVHGGIGTTIDDAVNDYFSDHADDECDYYLDEIDGSELVVTVWSCLTKDEYYAKYPSGDEFEDHWSFILDKEVEKIKFICKMVPNERYPDLPDIEYTEID